MTDRGSFRVVSYDLRPAKQVERRIFLEAFQVLLAAGVPLRDYKYAGFGSIYFYDFSLFYRYFPFKSMISIEHNATVKKRVLWNRPFDDIEVEFGTAASYIPKILPNEPHVFWLDYDYGIGKEIIGDIVSAASRLDVGSLLIATVDARPPKHKSHLAEFRPYIREIADTFLTEKHTEAFLVPPNFPLISRDVLFGAASRGLQARDGLSFLPLFSFQYEDSKSMCTFGGIIVDSNLQTRLERELTAPYFALSVDSPIYKIKVPCLTRRERLEFDRHLPSGKDPFPADFGITADERASYASIYKFFPTYAELL